MITPTVERQKGQRNVAWIKETCLPFFRIAFLLLCVLPAPAQEHIPPLKLPTFSLIQKSERFQLKAGETTWTVRYPPILLNTERITGADGEVLGRGKHYHIDFLTGTITFEDAVVTQKDVTWTLTYHTLPFRFQKVYRRELYGTQEPDAALDSTPIAEISRPDLQSPQPGTATLQPESQLEYSGSQTFGISVGSGRTFSPNHELRINVKGNVSDNIKVLATLSDQDLPIQPEGMTEDIQDIDEKQVLIMHPNVTGTLGDLQGTLGPSEFIFFPRALEGVKVAGDFSWGRFHLIPSAIPKGLSTSKVIQGQEGRSEYRLDVNGQFVIVKAGSEIVWLNGEKMRRGENNDYVVREYGDPIVEFNSKHLITSNDVIRVDFEYIPEDRAYQQNVYGISSVFILPGEKLTFGAAYAVESDLNQPDQALILIDEDDLAALRQNILDPDGDGFLLTPPQKHTVWGLESRLNLTEQAWIDGQLSFSAIDNNTYSTVDRKRASQAWKLIGHAGWDKFSGNLDIRSYDADFVPVGASHSNRTRARYETQYATEGFEDALLFGDTGAVSFKPLRDERTLTLDLQALPYPWIQLNLGAGRTVEREVGAQEAAATAILLRNNLNWGIHFNRRSFRGGSLQPPYPPSQGRGHFNSGIYEPLPSGERDVSDTRTRTDETGGPAQNVKKSFLEKLPSLRWNAYRSASHTENGHSTEVAENLHKSRHEGSLSYLLSPFEFIGTYERFTALDDYTAALNRKRNRSAGRVNLVKFKWASINTSYEIETGFAKTPLLTVDGETLGVSDWMQQNTARTWRVGLFSQQGQWASVRTNLTRRIVKSHTDLGPELTTQLADVTLQLTPLSRAIDIELTYELDKKLTTQRREIYTDIHPHTGHRLQPGEGFYVRLDDLRYVEDAQEGTYIKIYQNVGDKPTTAVDAAFRLRLQPRQFFARRARSQRNSTATDSMRRSALPPRNERGDLAATKTERRQPFTWFLNALGVQTRLWLTEEQEAEDAISLYLLQSLQGSQTLFGRVNQHHRLDFSPSPQFRFEVNFRNGRTLNRRINTQERYRNYRTWDAAFSVNPTQRFSVGANWEQRRETERYSQLHFPESETAGTDVVSDSELFSSTPISDLHQFEQTTELKLQYELSRALRWSGTGGYKRTTDIEQLDDEPDAKTRTLSFKNSITYGIFGKGRIEVHHTLGSGKSDGGIPFAQYYFYEGISHEVRANADYRLRKFTDLLFRLNYRLLSTKQRKPEHRLEMTVSAEL